MSMFAVEPHASDLAATLIQQRATAVSTAGDPALAETLQQLADGVQAGRITLADAQSVLAILGALPPAGGASGPRVSRTSSVPPPPPPAPVAAAVPPSAAQPPPAEAAAIPGSNVTAVLDGPGTPKLGAKGEVLAIQIGSDGDPALVAISVGQLQGVREGQRFAIQRDHATVVMARANQVKDDMTIALLIPGTWHSTTKEIGVGDVAVVIDP
jgi:hypothetical protein